MKPAGQPPPPPPIRSPSRVWRAVCPNSVVLDPPPRGTCCTSIGVTEQFSFFFVLAIKDRPGKGGINEILL